MYRSLNSAPVAPRSISSSVTGFKTPSSNLICSTAEEDTSLKKLILLFEVSITTLFNASASPMRDT